MSSIKVAVLDIVDRCSFALVVVAFCVGSGSRRLMAWLKYRGAKRIRMFALRYTAFARFVAPMLLAACCDMPDHTKARRKDGASGSPPDNGAGCGNGGTGDENDSSHDEVFVVTCINGKFTHEWMSRAAADELDDDDVDLVVDTVHWRGSVRLSTGERLHHQKGFNGIGESRLSLLFKFMRKPGAFLGPYQLANMEPPNDAHGAGPAIVASIACLRRDLLGEPGLEFYLETSSGTRYRFRRERSFRVISYHKDWWLTQMTDF